MKISIHLFIISFVFFVSPHVFTCPSTIRPHEWPLYDNRESCPEEAQEFLSYLLDQVNCGLEFALDAWAHQELHDGIKKGLHAPNKRKPISGFRVYRNTLEAAAKSNTFALLALKKCDESFETESVYNQLALAQNPQFLTEIATNPNELKYFWKEYGSSYQKLPGTDAKEKLLNLAISKKWNVARMEKATMLFERFSQTNNRSDLEEAFDLLRYAASRGFAKAMYSLHIDLQTYPDFSRCEGEVRGYLEAAAEFDNPNVLYTSANFLFEDGNYPAMRERLARLTTLINGDSRFDYLAHARDALKELALLAERGMRQNNFSGFVVERTYEPNTNLVTESMLERIKYLRTMFDEVDRMNDTLANESNEEIEDAEDPSLDENTDMGESEDDSPEVVNSAAIAQPKTLTVTSKKNQSSQKLLSKKKSKVTQRKDKRATEGLSHKEEPETNPATLSFAENPFSDAIRARLNPVKNLVATLLDGRFLNGREMLMLFNSFQGAAVENTVGSHNKVNLQWAEDGPQEKTTIVTPHMGKRRDRVGKYKSMSGKMRRLINGLGITKIEDLG